MMQMRWLLKNEFGYDGMDTKKVLQYRYMRKVRPMKAREWRDSERVDRWGPWINVPTVEEQK